jgi:hypothetical protein
VAKIPAVGSLFIVLSEAILIFFSLATDFSRASTYSSGNKKKGKNSSREKIKDMKRRIHLKMPTKMLQMRKMRKNGN